MQIFFGLFVFTLFLSCSTSENSFVKTFGGSGPDRGIHLVQTSDDNIIIVGNTMNEAMDLDVYLIKCTQSGDTLWTRSIGIHQDDNGWCIKETQDKGFIIVGFTKRLETELNDVLLLKTDSLGNEEWFKTFGGPGDDIGWSIAINDDHGYTIAAQTDSYGKGDLDAYLIRTDSRGDSLWTKTFGGPLIDRVFSIDLADDQNILLAGISYSYGAGDRDAYLIKTDENGRLLWQRTYGGMGYDNAHTVIVNDSGKIILTGYGEHWGSSSNMNIFLKQISMHGDELWTKSYGGPAHDRAMSVYQTQDSGYIITGFTQSFGQGEWDIYVVKTDSQGDSLWTSTYGTPAPDFGYDVIQSHAGEYFITGWSHGYGHSESDLVFIKSEF